jgi:hypothetical protein
MNSEFAICCPCFTNDENVQSVDFSQVYQDNKVLFEDIMQSPETEPQIADLDHNDRNNNGELSTELEFIPSNVYLQMEIERTQALTTDSINTQFDVNSGSNISFEDALSRISGFDDEVGIITTHNDDITRTAVEIKYKNKRRVVCDDQRVRKSKINDLPWTVKEDVLILALHKKYGQHVHPYVFFHEHWAHEFNGLHGTPNTLKSRISTLLFARGGRLEYIESIQSRINEQIERLPTFEFKEKIKQRQKYIPY